MKVFSLFFLLFLSSFSVAFAQSSKVILTPYEKKVKEINVRYFEIFSGRSMSWGDQIQLEQVLSDGGSAEFIMGLALMNFAMTNPKSYVEPIIKKYGAELKNAEKLKGSADIQKEKERKAKVEQNKKQKELQAQQEAYEIAQNKKQKELQAQQEAYAATDMGSIHSKIKSEYEKWNSKGEFEKEADFTERLKTKSKVAFEEICIKQIKEKINYYDYNRDNVKAELSTYNSESEFFTVISKFNNIEFQNKINIPITKAESFKNNWSDYKFVVDDYDWSFVGNNLCPTLVTIENENENSKYKLPLSVKNQVDISFLFDNFEVDNPLLSSHISHS